MALWAFGTFLFFVLLFVIGFILSSSKRELEDKILENQKDNDSIFTSLIPRQRINQFRKRRKK